MLLGDVIAVAGSSLTLGPENWLKGQKNRFTSYSITPVNYLSEREPIVDILLTVPPHRK
jgi:hypothetical protein